MATNKMVILCRIQTPFFLKQVLEKRLENLAAIFGNKFKNLMPYWSLGKYDYVCMYEYPEHFADVDGSRLILKLSDFARDINDECLFEICNSRFNKFFIFQASYITFPEELDSEKRNLFISKLVVHLKDFKGSLGYAIYDTLNSAKILLIVNSNSCKILKEVIFMINNIEFDDKYGFPTNTNSFHFFQLSFLKGIDLTRRQQKSFQDFISGYSKFFDDSDWGVYTKISFKSKNIKQPINSIIKNTADLDHRSSLHIGEGDFSITTDTPNVLYHLIHVRNNFFLSHDQIDFTYSEIVFKCTKNLGGLCIYDKYQFDTQCDAKKKFNVVLSEIREFLNCVSNEQVNKFVRKTPKIKWLLSELSVLISKLDCVSNDNLGIASIIGLLNYLNSIYKNSLKVICYNILSAKDDAEILGVEEICWLFSNLLHIERAKNSRVNPIEFFKNRYFEPEQLIIRYNIRRDFINFGLDNFRSFNEFIYPFIERRLLHERLEKMLSNISIALRQRYNINQGLTFTNLELSGQFGNIGIQKLLGAYDYISYAFLLFFSLKIRGIKVSEICGYNIFTTKNKFSRSSHGAVYVPYNSILSLPRHYFSLYHEHAHSLCKLLIKKDPHRILITILDDINQRAGKYHYKKIIDKDFLVNLLEKIDAELKVSPKGFEPSLKFRTNLRKLFSTIKGLFSGLMSNPYSALVNSFQASYESVFYEMLSDSFSTVYLLHNAPDKKDTEEIADVFVYIYEFEAVQLSCMYAAVRCILRIINHVFLREYISNKVVKKELGKHCVTYFDNGDKKQYNKKIAESIKKLINKKRVFTDEMEEEIKENVTKIAAQIFKNITVENSSILIFEDGVTRSLKEAVELSWDVYEKLFLSPFYYAYAYFMLPCFIDVMYEHDDERFINFDPSTDILHMIIKKYINTTQHLDFLIKCWENNTLR